MYMIQFRTAPRIPIPNGQWHIHNWITIWTHQLPPKSPPFSMILKLLIPCSVSRARCQLTPISASNYHHIAIQTHRVSRVNRRIKILDIMYDRAFYRSILANTFLMETLISFRCVLGFESVRLSFAYIDKGGTAKGCVFSIARAIVP